MQDAVGKSGRPIADVLEDAGISRNYYYKRLRGEMPFNTNDLSRIAAAVGIDMFDLLVAATQTNVTYAEDRFGRRDAPFSAPKSIEEELAGERYVAERTDQGMSELDPDDL
ncbi:hypothetical protein FM112_14075 [Gulosibacter sp. 10]|nr:hypothetical protein FM112_14075 [Gulosibacter sp. 10]